MARSLFQTLYARLALGLFVLLAVVGGLFTALSLYSVREYSAAVGHELNRDLASHLVADRNLVTEGQINQGELERLFDLYMSINPSIEIYLLDWDGRILSYSANPASIKRKHVSLGPIHTLLENPDAYPLQGDDPRSHDRRKVFSVTPVPNADRPTGYLYVVLRGEEYDFAESMVHSDRLLQMGGGALVISLFVGLLAGLLFFRLLTRRLSRLTARVEAFEAGATDTIGNASEMTVSGDDVDYLAARFDEMAARIAGQLELLKDKDHQRRQLVAQVSHDLRTPLASIQGYLETLGMKQQELNPEERQRFLGVALAETLRLSRLVDELFELAALDARERQPFVEPFMPAELLHDVVQKHQPKAERMNVVLNIIHVESAMVLGDIAMTERVLDNLIGNAIDHSPLNGEVALSVVAEGAGVAVFIEDMGEGIALQDIDHVFDPFYQAPGAHRTGHAGLGLAIARRIAELQQGSVSVESPPEAGARFCFWLPLADSTAKESTAL